MTATPVERYVRLCLDLGRHDDGVVDAYFGPPEIAAEVEAARRPSRARSGRRRTASSASSRTAAARQVVARAACSPASRFRTPPGSRPATGVRPRRTDDAVFRAAHARLEDLLPGGGTLAERYERRRTGGAERVLSTVTCGGGRS